MVAPIRRGVDGSDIFGVVASLTRDATLASFEVAAINNAAGVTWTAAQMLGGYIERSGAVAVSDTTPTAAAFLAAVPDMEVGDCRLLIIRNANTGTLTLTAATGVTITGTATVATVTTAVYMIRKTAATTISMTRLLAVAY